MPAQSSSRTPSVLVIERDDAVRRLIAVALERAGFRTFSAKDPQTAMAHGDETQHAVIVRDAIDGRTIVTTTTQARVFAVMEKPFDLEELVEVVSRCANSSRRTRHVPVKIESLRRFATSVAGLQHLLSLPVTSPTEAALRAEMRRILGALSATLDEAAHVETSRGRVALLRAASTVAAKLAITNAATGRDH